MDLQDIKNQKGRWCEKVLLTVDHINPIDEAEHGYCQILTVYDGDDQEGKLVYYFSDEVLQMTHDTPCKLLFQVRYKKDKEYFQCFPLEDEGEAVGPKQSKWEKKDRRIAKMSCIKSAVEFNRDRQMSDGSPIPVHVILGDADKFLTYIYDEEV